ncbi:hypothetical protein KI387_010271, partial [Taxus chinensis]
MISPSSCLHISGESDSFTFDSHQIGSGRNWIWKWLDLEASDCDLLAVSDFRVKSRDTTTPPMMESTQSVGGADYGSVRVGTFMGRQIIKLTASALLSQPSTATTLQECTNGIMRDDFDEYESALLQKEATLDYLCNLPPHRYEANYAKLVPEEMSGKNFMATYGSHNDPVTTIDPKRIYVTKDPTAHPIYENFHVNAFAALLSAASTDEQLSVLGEFLYQSHYSYSKCGLGSDGTDRLVSLVQQMQHTKKNGSERKGTLFGAKIT